MRRRINLKTGVTFYFLVTLVVFVILGAAYSYGTRGEVTVTIEDKWIKAAPNSEGEQSYMLATTGGVFTVRDDFFHLHFRSSDIYARVKVGETYCLKVTGFRFGPTSSYQNVYGFCD